MKKIFALILALCMIAALTACGSAKNAVAGTWTGTVDATDFILKDNPEVDGYLKSAPVAIVLELTADGKYTINTDASTIIPPFKEALRSYLVAYCEQEGVTVEQLEEAVKMTLDEYIDSAFEDMDMSALNESVSGVYTATDSTITFDPGRTDQVQGTWAGNTMSFTIDIGNVTLTRK
jgi:hypothetical protein